MAIQYTACPCCGERWNMQEIEDQECYTCGFPNPVLDIDNAVIDGDIDHLVVDSRGGLTTYFKPPNPLKGALNPLPERVLQNYYKY